MRGRAYSFEPRADVGLGGQAGTLLSSVPMSISQEVVPNPPPGGPLLVVMSARLMKVQHSFE